MSGEGIESVDEKLTAAFQRRERAQELLVRSMIGDRHVDHAHRGSAGSEARREEGGDVKTLFALVGLLLSARHQHQFTTMADPPACAICGRTGRTA